MRCLVGIVDGREDEKAPSASQLRTIATDMKPLLDRGHGPVAIVTDSAFNCGVARMFSVFAEVVRANVTPLHSMDNAQRWLSSRSAQSA